MGRKRACGGDRTQPGREDGDPGTGDGIATPFSFKHGAADIHSIRLRYTGAATGGVGLAFDNFSPACDTPILK